MIPILSIVTVIKDYYEVLHKLVEYDSSTINYSELGSILTYSLISIKNVIFSFFNLSWLKNVWSLPIIVPNISASMLSEISVLDGYFHNAFQFLETSTNSSFSYSQQNPFFYCLEKFSIGLINSIFLFLPTSTAHIITLRRFVMQGLEAGYMSGLGTIAGNIFWLSSIIFGWRFFVIPWLSFDSFRYMLGFLLLIKYMWDTYNEKKRNSTKNGIHVAVQSRLQFFLLNFLLVLTEQTSLYPFISNFSINPEVSLLETFPIVSSSSENFQFFFFIFIHFSYLLGIGLGSLSLLHLSCWFWENPAFKVYMWVISSFPKISISLYYKILNLTFLYLTMLSAITSIPYYGLDYTITKPLGYVSNDRIIQDKLMLETSFLGTTASDRNTRRNRGRHGRRERWKRRIRKYRTFDASLYDHGFYDLFTIEDLNYGFDRFWLRRKLRNHRVRFRFFPGPWMRSFKKQLAKPRLESYTGPRIEFFRILFEQVYHPSFHAYSSKQSLFLPRRSGRDMEQGLAKVSLPLASFDKRDGSAQPFPFAPPLRDEAALSPFGATGVTQTKVSLAAVEAYPKGQRDWLLRRQRKPKEQEANIYSPKKVLSVGFSLANLNIFFLNSKKDSIFNQGNRTNLPFLKKFSISPRLSYAPPQKGEEEDLSLFSLMENKGIPQIQQSKKNQISSIAKGVNQIPIKNYQIQDYLIQNNLQKSTLRKFLRKIDSRLNTSLILSNQLQFLPFGSAFTKNFYTSFPFGKDKNSKEIIISKQWKTILSKFSLPVNLYPVESIKSTLEVPFIQTSKLLNPPFFNELRQTIQKNQLLNKNDPFGFWPVGLRTLRRGQNDLTQTLSKKDLQILAYRSLLIKKIFDSESITKIQNQNFHLSFDFWSQRQKQPPLFFQNKQEVNKTSVLLHPLKFYLQQDTGLRKKLRYYTPNIYRNFSIENNAPYFRILMKRYFYHYKPTNRWERTLKAASLRTARRKMSRRPRKLQFDVNSQVLTSSLPHTKSDLPTLFSPFSSTNLVKNTYNYSIVSKRASRYRYQIYKDVLQHWYYSPFNRFLLKLDVDSFIRRQPNTHFLNKKEENLLHLRRFLLSEHYNTLRWYTNMEHYRSMKTQLNGSTKSFSSSIYNQQFAGTFKKIRHLFAITPTQGNINSTILKFDQPLYNEHLNTSKNPLLKPLFIHEELLSFPSVFSDPLVSLDSSEANLSLRPPTEAEKAFGFASVEGSKDLLFDSQKIIGNYLIQIQSERDLYIKKLLLEKNYLELTKFIFKGKKIRGERPVTNQALLNDQEKEYLLDSLDLLELDQKSGQNLIRPVSKEESNQTVLPFIQNELYLTYLKKWKINVNNLSGQESSINGPEGLKNYLKRKIKLYNERKIKKENKFIEKLQRFENYQEQLLRQRSSPKPLRGNGVDEATPSLSTIPLGLTQAKVKSFSPHFSLTSGLKKSIFEGFSLLDNQIIFTLNKKERYVSFPLNDLKTVYKNKLSKDFQNSLISFKKISNKGSNFFISMSPNSWKKFYFLNKSFFFLNNGFINKLKDKKQEAARTRQKSSRKEFKLLSKKSDSKNFESYFDSTDLSKSLNIVNSLRKKIHKEVHKNSFFLKTSSLDINKTNSNNKGFLFTKFLGNFKRKKSPQRRSRTRRPRGVFRKVTLNNSLKQDFKSFFDFLPLARRTKVYRKKVEKFSLDDNFLKQKFYTKLNEKLFSVSSPFHTRLNQFSSIISQPVEHKKFFSISHSLQKFFNFTQSSNGDQEELKQKRSKQRKQRSWKTKRIKFAQKRRKYRKRRRYSMSKLRSLSKKFKKVQNKNEMQHWWWKQYLPSIQITTEALLQIENEKVIEQKLSQLSIDEILKRYSMTKESKLQIGNKDFKPLALPESLKQISLLRPLHSNSSAKQQKEHIFSSSLLEPYSKNTFYLSKRAASVMEPQPPGLASLSKPPKEARTKQLLRGEEGVASSRRGGMETNSFNMLNNLYVNLFTNQVSLKTGFKELLLPNTSLPFYAGWDESLRKFVVTNRMLSRQDAGYALQLRLFSSMMKTNLFKKSSHSFIPVLTSLIENHKTSNSFVSSSLAPKEQGLELEKRFRDDKGSKELYSQRIDFTQAPLKGMNGPTTLYWQTPFSTYDPDQFFVQGLDGFAPLGWRQFLFRHSILKTWLNQINSPTLLENAFQSFANPQPVFFENKKGLIVKSKTNFLDPLVSASRNPQGYFAVEGGQKNIFGLTKNLPNLSKSKKAFAFHRRLKKRYRKVKKYDKGQRLVPSGPLLNEVLPLHYIYVFNTVSRFPRERYIKRRLLTDKGSPFGFETMIKQSFSNTDSNLLSYDFTLRKRLKPKRKYHLKRNSSKIVIPRRLKFMTFSTKANLSLATESTFPYEKKGRPLSFLKINKPVAELVKEQKIFRSKQQRQDLSKKQPNLRIKQLRRRVARQVLPSRSMWKFSPRAGGFVWPGDYLKLNLVKGPNLEKKQESKTFKQHRGKKYKKQLIFPGSDLNLPIQPKKYLYEKHNLAAKKTKGL
jgi:hypothetical protein